ncbi:M23 family metallopeptidase [Streptomyces sp. NPDC059629]|uniref:M23 family metallopeptidase n=1 Tax=Streptomyces sp. NPDC059629 TaxID=3346889 RepID=UPI0036BA2A1F
MRKDDLRLLTAALVLLLTGAFLTTPAKADAGLGPCGFGTPSTPPPDSATATDSAGAGAGAGGKGPHKHHPALTAATGGEPVIPRDTAGGPHWRHRHTGQDFAVDSGTPVYAVGPGRIVTASCGDAFGNQVVIQHPDGYYTQYAHLSVINVRPGQEVLTGQRIGAAGATGNADGPHLHFEVRTTPFMGSAVPPLPWLRGHGVAILGDPAGLAQSSKIPAQPAPAPGSDQTATHGMPEVRPPHHDGRPPVATGLPG